MIRALNADWLTAVVYQTIHHGMTKHLFLLLYLHFKFVIAIRPFWWFVVYGQYTTAKGCIQALLVESCIRTALSRDKLTIYYTP